MWWVEILKYNLIDVRAVDAGELFTLSHENFNFVVESVEWKVENTTLFAPLCLLTIQPSNEQQMPIKSSDRRLDDVGSRFHARDGKIKHSNWRRRADCSIFIFCQSTSQFSISMEMIDVRLDWNAEMPVESRIPDSLMLAFVPWSSPSLMSTHILIPFLHRPHSWQGQDTLNIQIECGHCCWIDGCQVEWKKLC